MRRIREVFRLQAEERSLGEIALSLNMAKSTVRACLERGRAVGLSWPLPSELDDAALEAKLYPGSTEVAKRAEPDWLQVRRELSSRRHHVTLSLLWLEYRQDHPDGYGYTQFCVKFRRWQQTQDLVMRFEYPDGERVFIDFCGDTMDVIDPTTGEVEQAQIFCAVLGASGYMYAEAVRSQDLESWLSAHVRMFGFYAGYPRSWSRTTSSRASAGPAGTTLTSTPATSTWPSTLVPWSSRLGRSTPVTRPPWRQACRPANAGCWRPCASTGSSITPSSTEASWQS